MRPYLFNYNKRRQQNLSQFAKNDAPVLRSGFSSHSSQMGPPADEVELRDELDRFFIAQEEVKCSSTSYSSGQSGSSFSSADEEVKKAESPEIDSDDDTLSQNMNAKI